MNTSRTAWSVVGQVADVLQIVATAGGILAVVLAGLGNNIFAQPNQLAVLVAMVAFAIVGSIAILTVIVRNRRPDAGFNDSRRATNKTLYTVGGLLLVLALAAGLLLILHPAANCASP